MTNKAFIKMPADLASAKVSTHPLWVAKQQWISRYLYGDMANRVR
jgi:hypothetical protein